MDVAEKAEMDQRDPSDVIAIVGMSVRVPGADSLEKFWENLKNGTESITFFDDDRLRAAGVDEATLSDPAYVKAMGRLDDIDLFDARFFDMTPNEAAILDPQHRVLLEGVWRALEHAAIDPERFPGRIGLYAGVGFNGYLIHHILTRPDLLESAGAWQLSLHNDKDFAPTRIAYKCNLQGPAVSVNTACSTSLVGTVLAAQSLLSYQCDAAIAGGCSIHLPQDQGYLHMEGGTLSPDGRCRPFDADAAGTVDGNGAAVVILKRLEDALKDGDNVHAILSGFAINNDGSLKVGYTAPSVSGQADVILEALEMAELDASSVDYVETHGTGTELGDTIEIKALSEAFRHATVGAGTCAIGSVKSNIGHLDTAAGVAGLIKTVLAMQHSEIPPTCHFRKANPKLELKKSPFFVNEKRIQWPVHKGRPKIAGVSSFGIGGTNAHVIVEQAPRPVSENGTDQPVILPIAARTEEALWQIAKELADHIEQHPEHSLADIAYTLQAGRRHFEFRHVFIVRESDRKACCMELRSENWSDPEEAVSDDEQMKTLAEAGSRWMKGEEIDWEAVAGKRRRLALPGHPFQRERFWIEPGKTDVTETVNNRKSTTEAISREPDIGNWFYLPGRRRVMPENVSVEPESRWLVVLDPSGFALAVTAELKRAGASVVTVHHTAENDAQKSGSENGQAVKAFQIDTTSETSWQWLFDTLKDWKPQQILHAGLYNADGTQEDLKNRAFDGLLALGQALGHNFFSDEIGVILLSDLLLPDGHNEKTGPAKAMSLGPLRVMAQEYPNLYTRVIDVDEHVRMPLLLSEIAVKHAPPAVILRGGERWIETFEPAILPEVVRKPAGLRENGVYLITGGMGNIGLTLAAYLAESVSARLVLAGRTPFPPRSRWKKLLEDDSTDVRLKQQIRTVTKIEAFGHSVLICEADVSVRASMKKVFARIDKNFGELHGVIHAAGLVGENSFVTLKDSRGDDGKKANEDQFIPKIGGIEILSDLLEDREFDFCLVCSSLSPILGGLGFSAYAASNLYADAAVDRLNGNQQGRWITVNWEGWRFEDEAIPEGVGASSAFELGMTAEEGIEVFSRIMDHPDLERIVISSGRLNDRIAQWVEKQVEPDSSEVTAGHARPDYIGPYTAPESATEKQLVSLWGKLLGIEGIGIHDSFFELGGNSLLLTQLVAMIRRTFQAELALSAMFEQPTVAEMASHIDDAGQEMAGGGERDEGFI